MKIDINDIGLMISIIDTVAKRGAINADEFEDVGGLRKRLVSFVEAAKKKAEAESEQESETK